MATTITFDWLNDTNLTISDSAESIYVNGASTTTFISSISLHNSHSGDVKITVYLVPDNSTAVGTAAAGNELFVKTLAADAGFTWNDSTLILGDTNDTIQAVASVANVANIFVFGAKKVTS